MQAARCCSTSAVCDWDDELLALFDVPRSMLPRIVPSSGICAHATIGGVDVPIAGIAGDQQAALFGQACHAPGLAKNTYGTGCFLLMNTGGKAVASTNNLLTTVAWQRSGKVDYALEGSVFIGGAVVQWLRDGLKIVRSAAEIEALASSVPDNGGVYVVPAFAGLGAPHWDAYARGAIFGLTRGSTSAHIARAALESIAFQSADVLTAMQKDAGIKLTELRVDGGATANNLLMQFQADILGVRVVRPTVLETTALGAGYLAGLAVGYWKDAADVAANWRVDRVFEPSMPAARVADLAAGWNKASGAPGIGRPDVPGVPPVPREAKHSPSAACNGRKRCICSHLRAYAPVDESRYRHAFEPLVADARLHLRPAAPRDARADAALRRPDGPVGAARHAVLAAAHARDRMARSRMSELARALLLDRTALSRTLDPLVERGFVAIVPGRDARTREVSLTRAGERAIRERRAALEARAGAGLRPGSVPRGSPTSSQRSPTVEQLHPDPGGVDR